MPYTKIEDLDLSKPYEPLSKAHMALLDRARERGIIEDYWSFSYSPSLTNCLRIKLKRNNFRLEGLQIERFMSDLNAVCKGKTNQNILHSYGRRVKKVRIKR
jgi:hypothetical protein